MRISPYLIHSCLTQNSYIRIDMRIGWLLLLFWLNWIAAEKCWCSCWKIEGQRNWCICSCLPCLECSTKEGFDWQNCPGVKSSSLVNVILSNFNTRFVLILSLHSVPHNIIINSGNTNDHFTTILYEIWSPLEVTESSSYHWADTEWAIYIIGILTPINHILYKS